MIFWDFQIKYLIHNNVRNSLKDIQRAKCVIFSLWFVKQNRQRELGSIQFKFYD